MQTNQRRLLQQSLSTIAAATVATTY